MEPFQLTPAARERKALQSGFVAVAVMLMIVGLLLVSLVAVRQSSSASSHVQRDYHDERVFYVAEGGADVAQAWLVQLLAVTPNPPQSSLDAFPPPALPEYSYPELSITKQALLRDVLITRGAMTDLRADIQPYEIRSHAANSNQSNEQIVRLLINQESISLYQFGLYYDEDLELFPNFPLDYMGRVHTNGDLYVGSHNTLDVDAKLSAAGNIYNTPKDPTQSFNGKALFKDADGHWHDLSYDSQDPYWVEQSLNDWDGNVQDSSHGVVELPFPLPTTYIPRDIIERGTVGDTPEARAKKYYYKAGLKIIDDVATDSAGNVVTLPLGVITNQDVYDCREQHNMAMRTLDMAALVASNKVPANRVIYISYSHARAAVRIKNAATLPSSGIVVATDNPLYVWGNYNVNAKKPSSLLCDAFNAYSGDWNDASANRPLNHRIASATAMNTCVVTGNQATTDGHYGGGAENLIRLHEKWVGHQLTYRGSLVCLWESEQAVGDFANACYVEAQRDWGFDPMLLDPDFWPKDGLSATQIARAAWRPY